MALLHAADAVAIGYLMTKILARRRVNSVATSPLGCRHAENELASVESDKA